MTVVLPLSATHPRPLEPRVVADLVVTELDEVAKEGWTARAAAIGEEF